MRNAAYWVLSVVFLVGLVMFFSFSFEMRHEGAIDESRKIEKHTIGSPWPWFERRSETVTKVGEEHTTRSDHLRLDSPAWLILLATIAVGYGIYRVSPRPAEGGK